MYDSKHKKWAGYYIKILKKIHYQIKFERLAPL